jgi:hypothetical protein
MNVLPARSIAEADIYLTLRPCVCGSTSQPQEISAVSGERGDQFRYSGTCGVCGRERTFLFEIPQHAEPAPEHAYAGPDAPPSEIIDAGEWWLIAQLLAEAATVAEDAAEPERTWLDEDAWEWMDGALSQAVSAVDEVLRFLPTGGSELSDVAFWTPSGSQLWQRSRDEFSAERLFDLREAYGRRLETFRREHPDPFQEVDLDSPPETPPATDTDRPSSEGPRWT